jgi:probable O-glycosylation ligase (exosortase A-associated)
MSAWSGELAWDQWSKVMKILLMIFVTMLLIGGKEKIRYLILTVVVALGFYGVKGGIFSVLTGGQFSVQGPGGFIAGNTEIGLALVMVLPLIAAVAQEQSRVWLRYAAWSAFWLSVVAIVFTYSRGALLGLAAVIAMTFLRAKHKILVVLIAVPLAAFVVLPLIPEQLVERAGTIRTYEDDSSAMGRIMAWGVAWNIAKNHVFGAGFNLDYIDVNRWLAYTGEVRLEGVGIKSAHSIYFQILGEHGFIGLFLFVGLILSTLIVLRHARMAAESGDARDAWISRYAYALRSAMLGYMVSGAFLSLAYFDLFYLYVALAAILYRDSRSVGSRVDASSAPTTRPRRPLATAPRP